jgi:hypothetical protein
MAQRRHDLKNSTFRRKVMMLSGLVVFLTAGVLVIGCDDVKPPEPREDPAKGADRVITLAWSGDQPPHLGFGSLNAVRIGVDGNLLTGGGQQSLTAPAGVAEEHGQQTVSIQGTVDAEGNLKGEVRVKYVATHDKDGSTTSNIDRRWGTRFTGRINGDRVTMDAPGEGTSKQTYAPVDGTEIKPDNSAWTFTWKAAGTIK